MALMLRNGGQCTPTAAEYRAIFSDITSPELGYCPNMLRFSVQEPGICLELPRFGKFRITRVFQVWFQLGYHPYLHSIHLSVLG